MKIAVLGLGAMGSRMAHRLLDTHEHEVNVWNRTRAAAEPLVRAGAVVAETPARATVGCDLALSMLRDDDAVRDVWLGPDGALAHMASGAVGVDCSTVTPAVSRALAGRAAEHGVAFLDAPVVGSRPQAEAGALIFLVGGDVDVLARTEPVLRTLGGAVHHMGPAGTGAQMKLMVNALFAVQVAALAELIGGLAGTSLQAARAVEVLGLTPVPGPAATGAATAMLATSFPPAFPVELVAKDLAYAVADATGRGASALVTTTAHGIYERAVEAGLGGQNITSVVQLHRL